MRIYALLALAPLLYMPMPQDCLVNPVVLRQAVAGFQSPLSVTHGVNKSTSTLNYLSFDPELDRIRGSVEFFQLQGEYYRTEWKNVADACDREANKIRKAINSGNIEEYKFIPSSDNVERLLVQTSDKLSHRVKILSENNRILKLYAGMVMARFQDLVNSLRGAFGCINIIEKRNIYFKLYLNSFCEEIENTYYILNTVIEKQDKYIIAINDALNVLRGDEFETDMMIIDDVLFDTESDDYLNSKISERLKCSDDDFIIMSFEELEEFNRES